MVRFERQRYVFGFDDEKNDLASATVSCQSLVVQYQISIGLYVHKMRCNTETKNKWDDGLSTNLHHNRWLVVVAE